MKFIITVLALTVLVPQTLGAAEQPNLVIVFIDDIGWGDFSCFGNDDAATPPIDRLASEGVRFDQFYLNSPICSPSRTAISTGQYPRRWRITSFLNNRENNEQRGMAQWLDPHAPMLARFLLLGRLRHRALWEMAHGWSAGRQRGSTHHGLRLRHFAHKFRGDGTKATSADIETWTKEKATRTSCVYRGLSGTSRKRPWQALQLSAMILACAGISAGEV